MLDGPTPSSGPPLTPWDRPIRVLHITETTIAGVKRHVLDLLGGFVERADLQVEVACPPLREGHGGDTSFVDEVRGLGVPVHLVEMRRSINPSHEIAVLWQLMSLIRRGRYDVVHLHSSKAGALGRAATWLAYLSTPGRRPRTVYTPNAWSFLIPGSRVRSLVYTWIERLLGHITDRLIVVSKDERREALSRSIMPAVRTRLVRSGVTPGCLPTHQAGDAKREEQGWGPRGELLVIGTVARLTLQKDPFTWLRAAALAIAQRPDLKLVWIGHGELEPEFLTLARELGLLDGVHFQYLGYRQDARELIAALDIFTLSSLFEAGLPYVLMEAMAMARPVAATAGSGSRELIEDGVSGVLVRPGDANALADAMLRLAQDAELRDRLGQAGREMVLRNCTTDRQVEETAQVYFDALASMSAPMPRVVG